MEKRFISLLPFLLSGFIFSCKTVTLSNYLRVYDKERHFYHFTKDSAGILLSYEDTLTCNIIVRRGVFADHVDDNYNLFYFEDSQKDTSVKDIFTYDIPLSEFTYCLKGGALYVCDYMDRGVNQWEIPLLQKVLPKRIKKGKMYIYKSGDYKREFTFLEMEKIDVNPMFRNVSNNALKFSISFSSRQGQKTTDTIWLLKKFGVVKWKKLNGYTGQLNF